MIIIFVTFLTALALSVIAAYFSVIGLMAIFAAAAIPIAVMGAALEAAKVVAASWAYRNWKTAPRVLRYYLVSSVVVLSLITSMGIFGYLSKAHLDQSLPSNDVIAKVALLDEKIKVEKDNVETNRKALKQFDEAVAIVNMLGQLPTSSNAHGLWLKLREQVEPHLPKEEKKEP